MLLQFSGVIKLADTGIPYPVYVFSGTLLWQIFTEALSSPIQQINASKGVLSKLNFPREAILLSGIYKVLFNALIKVIILIPIVFLFDIIPDWKIILFPLAVLSMILVGFTIGLILAPIGSLYTDIGRLIPMGAQFLMYLSPVVYAIPVTGIGATLFKWNFTTPLLMTARDFLTAGNLEWINYFLIVNGIALVVLLFAWFVFKLQCL